MRNSNVTLCPFCVNEIQLHTLQCPNCKKTIPPAYLEKSSQLPPTILGVVGFRGHGKTVYLAGLMYALSRLSKIWPGFYRQALNLTSLQTVHENMRLLREGQLPEGTNKNFSEPSIHLLSHIPTLNEQLLLIYDSGGENFDVNNPFAEENMEENVGFIRRSQSILFLISLPALKRDEDETGEEIAERMHNLLNIYKLGLSRLGGDTIEQHLIVAYTMADQLSGWFDNYPKVWQYVRYCELENEWPMDWYVHNLKQLSKVLGDYTCSTLHAADFYNMAHDQFASVQYCITSALGSSPVGGHLTTQMSPRRVIDPLLWSMLNSRSNKYKFNPLRKFFSGFYLR